MRPCALPSLFVALLAARAACTPAPVPVPAPGWCTFLNRSVPLPGPEIPPTALAALITEERLLRELFARQRQSRGKGPRVAPNRLIMIKPKKVRGVAHLDLST